HACENFSAHVARSTPGDDPLLYAFLAMDMDERWVQRAPQTMLATFHGYQGEGFDLIVEDVLAIPADQPIVVEGFRLLPRLLTPLLTVRDHAVWLIPTPQFRRAAFARRGSLRDIPGRTTDPGRALANLLARDELFTNEVAAEAAALRLTTVDVDG